MDRVAMLSLHDAQPAHQGAKRRGQVMKQQKRSSTKVPRTDSGSDGSMLDVCCSDSAQSAYAGPVAQQQQHHYPQQHQQQHRHCGRRASIDDVASEPDAAAAGPAGAPHAEAQLAASEDLSDCSASGSGSEADCAAAVAAAGGHAACPPAVLSDRYIKGTRLIVGGWFQACRGCNEPTARTSEIGARDVPLCHRCQAKYQGMVSGEYPPNVGAVDTAVEPLAYWLPRMLGSIPRMEAAARRDFCDGLVLRQDDAWIALIKSS